MDLFYLYCSLKTTCDYQPHYVGEQFYSKKERLCHYGLLYMNYSPKTTCSQSPSWDCAIMDLCYINYHKRLLVCCLHLGAFLLFIFPFVYVICGHIQVLVSYLDHSSPCKLSGPNLRDNVIHTEKR